MTGVTSKEAYLSSTPFSCRGSLCEVDGLLAVAITVVVCVDILYRVQQVVEINTVVGYKNGLELLTLLEEGTL
jgi:hypothetical protein